MSQELLKQNPELKFLFMSGYSNEALDKYGNVSKNANFIAKPFKLAQFVTLVHTILEKE